MMINIKKISLKGTILIGFSLIMFFSMGIVFLFSANTMTEYHKQSKNEYAMSICKIVANSKIVKEAFTLDNPSVVIQPYVENIRRETTTEFIVVMNKDSIRYSHSNPSLIGLKFTGDDEKDAFSGKSYISKAVGISGESTRAFSPIYINGEVAGAVSVGFFDNALSKVLKELISPMRFSYLLGFLFSFYGAVYLTSYIKKQIFNLEPNQIATLLEEKETIIESMRDGIVSINKEGKINLINDVAKDIIGINKEENIIGKSIETYIPNTRLKIVMNSKNPEYDMEQVVNGRVIITNRVPLVVKDKVIGAMAFFRDKTDLFKLAEELTGVKEYAGALRARSHEFMNKLQTIGGLLEFGRIDTAKKLVDQTTKFEQDQVSVLVRQFNSPELVGIILGKLSLAQESGIKLIVEKDSKLNELDKYVDANSIITIVGNILQNSIEALKGIDRSGKWIRLYIQDGDNIVINIKNNGPRIPDSIIERMFNNGFSTKGYGRGIGLFLVNKIITSSGGSIKVDSREDETLFSITIPRR